MQKSPRQCRKVKDTVVKCRTEQANEGKCKTNAGKSEGYCRKMQNRAGECKKCPRQFRKVKDAAGKFRTEQASAEKCKTVQESEEYCRAAQDSAGLCRKM
jgi:hypothetical protein